MVKLQLLFIPYVTGYVHVQTNTKYSYCTTSTIENARSEHPHLGHGHYYAKR
jgi:hypothetical protein